MTDTLNILVRRAAAAVRGMTVPAPATTFGQARPVIGGVFIPLLNDETEWKRWLSRNR